MTSGQFIRFEQGGVNFVLPRPTEIKPINMTKSKRHHLNDGEVSTSNNTAQFFKFVLEYKDGVIKEHLQAFIDLMLTENREFEYFQPSTARESTTVWIKGKLDITFLYGTLLHCVGMKLEFNTNED